MIVGIGRQFCAGCQRVRTHEIMLGLAKCVVCEGVKGHDKETNETVAN